MTAGGPPALTAANWAYAEIIAPLTDEGDDNAALARFALAARRILNLTGQMDHTHTPNQGPDFCLWCMARALSADREEGIT